MNTLRVRSAVKTYARCAFIILLTACVVGAAEVSVNVLKGVVTDENKAVIPQAKITLRDDKGATRETTSDADGNFSFGDVALGKYQLIVVKEGFGTVEREINFDGGTASSDLTLTAGEVSESVTIVMDGGEEAAVTATFKLPVSVHETPRSLTVVGEERIRDQNFRQVSDVVTYVPGVTPNSYRNGSYHFYARGYRQSPDDTRLDGFAGINVGGGGFGASMFGVEEAVVLRGPASLLYGQTGSPGGFINLVSKRPQERRFTRLDLRGGGYGGNGVALDERPSFGFDLDSTGAVTKSERVLYRALFTMENMNYFTLNTLDRNRYANLSASIKLDRDGRFVLTPSLQHTRYNRPYGGGIVVSPTTSLRTNDGVNGPINENDLSPLDVNLSAGRRLEETSWAGLDFRGVVSERIRVNAAYRYVSFDTDINQFAPQVTSAAQINQLVNQGVVSRVQAKSRTQRNYNNFNADASYEWLNNGWWRNTTQVGFYDRALESRATTAGGAVPGAQSPINIYTGQFSAPLRDTYPPLVFGLRGRDNIWNGYLQNRTSLDNGRWNFTLGLNYGQNNPVTGATRKSGLLPNAAAVFNATERVAIYASYATSFNPNDPDVEDALGNRGTFAPTIGRSYEAGVKYDLLNRRVSTTFALFQNQIDNSLVLSDVNVFNSRGNRFYTPAGTRRARGAEATGDFQVRPDLRVSAGVSYLDAIYKGFPATATQSSSPIPNSRAEKSPRWSYNVYSRYSRAEGFMKGFGAGLGLFWQGARVGSNGAQTFAAPDPLLLPSFTRVDSALFYRVNRHVDFAFNVENLFDRLIFVNASVGSNIEIAAPRTMTLRTTFTF